MAEGKMTLTPQDIDAIAEAVAKKQNSHSCRIFTEPEVHGLRKLAETTQGDDWKKWQALLDLGGSILIAKKTAIGAMIVAVVTFIGALITFGIKEWVKK